MYDERRDVYPRKVDMRKQKKYTLRSVIVICILTICVAEVLLRVTGVIVLLLQRHSAGDPDGYTVLAVGESTTALSQWPVLLQQQLSEIDPEREWRVVNEGVPGTTSSHIVSRMPELLNKYRPDVVITMIGANDANALLVPSGTAHVMLRIIRDLRVVKVMRLISSYLVAPSDAPDVWGKLPEADVPAMTAYHSAMEAVRTGRYTEAITQFNTVLERDSTLTNAALLGLGRAYTAVSRLPEAAAVYERVGTREGWPDSDIVQIVQVYQRMGLSDADINRKLQSYKPDLTVTANRTTTAAALTAANYKIIHEAIGASGAVHVVMQYPTLAIEPLKQIFANGEDVIFVENVTNFFRVLQTNTYSDVFTDTFGETWGHTTGLGDSVIASAAAEAIRSAFVTYTP